MPKTILVTGVNGFVGHHVAHELVEHGTATIGLGHDKEPSIENASALTAYISADLTDPLSVKNIDLTQVDAVIHLAGLANVGQSFVEPAQFLSANTSMSINLLQHALNSHAKTRFIVVSSGAVYESNQPLPITECGKVTHGSPYAVSKLAVEMMNDYYRSRGLDVVTMRPFNHIGPGQGAGFVVPDLLTQLTANCQSGTAITVGDLDTARDYTDVRDVAAAYVSVAIHATKPRYSVYNVCSGASKTGREILAALSHAMGFDKIPDIIVDQSRIRPNDVRNIYGDSSRLRNEFDWQPRFNLEDTVRDIIASDS